MNYDFFSRHSRVVLLFSAGKDSAACLELLRPCWDKLTVVWCDSGDAYPETKEYMREIEARVPRFVRLSGAQPAFIAQHGRPVDLVPLSPSQRFSGFTSFMRCCSANLWEPVAAYITQEQVTGIITGQKLSDELRSPVNSGDKLDALEVWHPLEHWTDDDVRTFLGPRIPQPYLRGLKSSLDCMSCTAYLADNGPRIRELRHTHPDKYAVVAKAIAEWSRHVVAITENATEILNEPATAAH
jgi:phosphoadenosine phosphosulfate reductase